MHGASIPRGTSHHVGMARLLCCSVAGSAGGDKTDVLGRIINNKRSGDLKCSAWPAGAEQHGAGASAAGGRSAPYFVPCLLSACQQRQLSLATR
jgi:hypothetical protein